MTVVERIRGELESRAPLHIVRVSVGRKYCAVASADGAVGVALTQLPGGPFCCHEQEPAPDMRDEADARLREIEGRLVRERSSSHLLPLLSSPEPPLAAVALACANAMVNRQEAGGLEGDLLEHLDLRPSDTVGMVGLFEPLLPSLRSTVESLHIFDLNGRGGAQSADEALDVLPSCDVALITAAAITNGTIDGLLKAASRCRQVALLGASTPLLADAFRDTPVSWLSGSIVVKTGPTLRVVGEGGGRREFGRFLAKRNLRCG